MYFGDQAFIRGVPGIDQILSIVSQQGADELRLGTDEEPQVFAAGVRKRFVMSATPEPVLRHLLGELLTPDRDRQLHSGNRLEFDYDTGGIGRFHVVLASCRDKGIEVIFTSLAGFGLADATRHAPEIQSRSSRRSPSDELSTKAARADDRATESAIAEQSSVKQDSELQSSAELNHLVMLAVGARASDIHLADDEPPYLRVDGQLQRVNDSPAFRVDSLFSIS